MFSAPLITNPPPRNHWPLLLNNLSHSNNSSTYVESVWRALGAMKRTIFHFFFPIPESLEQACGLQSPKISLGERATPRYALHTPAAQPPPLPAVVGFV